MGFAYDWSREVNTCLPEYYKWNQWIFLKMYERGLAYRERAGSTGARTCRTVLANEQAAGGACWRCSIARRAEKDGAVVPEDHGLRRGAPHRPRPAGQVARAVLPMQQNWIGRSEGRLCRFRRPRPRAIHPCLHHPGRHDLRGDVPGPFARASPGRGSRPGPRETELQAWIARTVADARLKREIGEAEKEGVDTGPDGGQSLHRRSRSDLDGQLCPDGIRDRAPIMAVPAHDGRDYEFAHKYGLPIREVIAPEGGDSVPREAEAELFEDSASSSIPARSPG